ncbi:glycosyltransferase [Emticicia fontis]
MKNKIFKSKSPRIFFILPTLKGGGAEKNTINILNSIDLNFYNASLIICGGENNYGQLLPKNLDIIYLKKKSVKHAIFNIYKILSKERVDIVFTTSEHLSTFIVLFKKVFSKKFISITRVPTLPSNKLAQNIKSKIVSKLSYYTYKFADVVISQSEQMKEELVNILNIKESKIAVIPNLVNQSQIHQLSIQERSNFVESDYNVVSVGTLGPAKGFDLLIKALPNVVKQIPTLKLHILGEEGSNKGYKQFLTDLIISLNLENRVILHGFKSNPYPFLKDANLFILSSRKEGFPNVVLEALSLGTVVLATNCVSFNNIIFDYKNGLVVEKNSVKSLENGIIECQQLSKQNPTVLENFNFNNWLIKQLNKNAE